MLDIRILHFISCVGLRSLEAYNEYDELVERNKFFMNIDIDEV